MGLASLLLGEDNGISKWAGENQNYLTALASGLASGPDFSTGLARGLQLVPGARADHLARKEKLKADALTESQSNYTLQTFAKDAPDLLDAYKGGAPISELWPIYLQRKQPKGSAAPVEINGQLVDPTTYQVLGDYRTPDTPDAPSVSPGYMMNPDGSGMTFIPGGPADPNNPLNSSKLKGINDLSATETKELFDTEDKIQSANNVISALDTAISLNSASRAGWGAEQLAGIGANLPDWIPGIGGNETEDANTLQLKNVVTEQALNQLKLVFGGNPTEGERQILIDIQGSVNQPAEVRARIFARAKELALQRLKFNEERAAKIQSGGYGAIQQPGAATSAGTAAPNPADPLGLF